MTSTVSRTIPVAGSLPVSAEMRSQFGATADDIEALQAGKQDALVSGTSLKTINGSSLLGSGDLVVGGGGGSGTVTSVSVTTANGVSGSVATATTTPAISLTLGAITPTSVAASGTVTGSNLSGTNTGDQTNISGNAATVTTNANLTGPVTSTGNATAIANGAISNAMLANAAVANLSGTNTGDETGARVATLLHAASAKVTLVDADEVNGTDSAASFGLIRTTWINVKAFLKTYFDTLYAPKGAATASGLTMSTNKLLGRNTATTGAIEEITLGTNLSFSGTTLNAAGGGGSGTVTATAGSLTSNAVVLGAGTTDTKVSTGITTDGAGAVTLTPAANTSALTVASHTHTTSNPAISVAQTWNAGAVTFTAWLLNVTNTASAAASKLIDLQVGGTTQFYVAKNGDFSAAAGSVSYAASSGTLTVSQGGVNSALALGASGSLSRNISTGEWLLNSGNASFPITFSMSGTVGQFVTGGFVLTGLLATSAAAPTIASAATIAPAKIITFISGTTTIDTITAPAPIATRGGQITLIPTGAWATSTAGNVALATTAVANKALILTYDTTTAKWYPSY